MLLFMMLKVVYLQIMQIKDYNEYKIEIANSDFSKSFILNDCIEIDLTGAIDLKEIEKGGIKNY